TFLLSPDSEGAKNILLGATRVLEPTVGQQRLMMGDVLLPVGLALLDRDTNGLGSIEKTLLGNSIAIDKPESVESNRTLFLEALRDNPALRINLVIFDLARRLNGGDVNRELTAFGLASGQLSLLDQEWAKRWTISYSPLDRETGLSGWSALVETMQGEGKDA